VSGRPVYLDQLAGRNAVVTGAAGGIGYALAGALAAAGMRVLVADIDEAAARQAADRLIAETGGEVLGAGVDVSKEDKVEGLAELARERLGPVHVLCNNAGVQMPGKAWDFTRKEWDWLLGVNLYGVIHGLRAFLPEMIASGEPGHVVNTASVGGLVAYPGLGMYTAAKFAVVGLSETLARDLVDVGARIGVTILCPGPTLSSLRENSGRLSPDGQGGREVPTVTQIDRMPAERVAEMTVDAIRRNRFWLVTHPEYLDMIRERARGIVETDATFSPPSLDEAPSR
jgi:NAD(P)-dependent dehydrogenase (short-subunit alcohol dehydrogenase family)